MGAPRRLPPPVLIVPSVRCSRPCAPPVARRLRSPSSHGLVGRSTAVTVSFRARQVRVARSSPGRASARRPRLTAARPLARADWANASRCSPRVARASAEHPTARLDRASGAPPSVRRRAIAGRFRADPMTAARTRPPRTIWTPIPTRIPKSQRIAAPARIAAKPRFVRLTREEPKKARTPVSGPSSYRLATLPLTAIMVPRKTPCEHAVRTRAP
jgi:hypothetical protein